jgi:hypothetical protein
MLTAGLMGLLAGAAGCGDPPRVVVRDTLTTMNEVADVLMDINDESTAKDVLKSQIEPLKKKWENVRKRQEEFSKFDKEHKTELKEALDGLMQERKATGARLKAQIARLNEIRRRTTGPVTSLTAAAKVPEDFKPFASGWRPPGTRPDAWLDDPLKGLEPQFKKR